MQRKTDFESENKLSKLNVIGTRSPFKHINFSKGKTDKITGLTLYELNCKSEDCKHHKDSIRKEPLPLILVAPDQSSTKKIMNDLTKRGYSAKVVSAKKIENELEPTAVDNSCGILQLNQTVNTNAQSDQTNIISQNITREFINAEAQHKLKRKINSLDDQNLITSEIKKCKR